MPKAPDLESRSLGPQTALLVIDVQVGLFQKNTPLYLAEALLERINALSERARQAEVPVIYVQHCSDKVLKRGTPEWELHPDLMRRADEPVIFKTHGNAFEETRLGAELEKRRAGRLVITGLVTHGCVRATCEGALALGYRVVLAADGHSSYSKDAARLIEEWNQKLEAAGAEVVPAVEVRFA